MDVMDVMDVMGGGRGRRGMEGVDGIDVRRGFDSRRGGRGGRGMDGMVTAEFAVVLPAVVLVLALSLGALGLALDQIRCVDAARVGARAAARGDSYGAVILVTRRGAPSSAQVSVATSGDLVEVSVVSQARVAGSLLPAWLRASSTASAVLESSDPPP